MDTLRLYLSINAAGFVLSLAILTIFFRYLLKVRASQGNSSSIPAATALVWYFTGNTILRGSLVVATFFRHEPAIAAIMVSGALLSVVGALCIVRVFATAYYDSQIWLALAVTAAASALFFSAF